MTTLYNRINIRATPEQVWHVLADPARLDQYDPIVRKSTLISALTTGIGVERRCETTTGWFTDKVSEWRPFEKLTFVLTGCNQPMKNLEHAYTLTGIGDQTEVTQVMKYTMKFGFLGLVLDAVAGRRTSDKQIKKFLLGLKSYTEKENVAAAPSLPKQSLH